MLPRAPLSRLAPALFASAIGPRQRQQTGGRGKAGEEQDDAASGRYQIGRCGRERRVDASRKGLKPPGQKGRGGRDADAHAERPRHVKQSTGFSNELFGRGPHHGAVVRGCEQALTKAENRKRQHNE
jgi:hypothetical protein